MKRFTIAIAALLVLAAPCTSTSESAPTTSIGTTGTRPPIQAIPVSYGLQPFDACEDFLDYVKTHAVDMVGPYGFEYGYYGPWFRGGFAVEELAAADDGAGVPANTAAPSLQQGVDY